VQETCKQAISWGATNAVPICVKDVVVSDWVRLKCQYGCAWYGRCFTCPPFTPTPAQTRKILSEYSEAILLRFVPDKPHANREESVKYETFVRIVAAKVERELFLKQFYKSFALHSGPCVLCKLCVILSPTGPFRTASSLVKEAIRKPALIKKAIRKPSLVKEFGEHRGGIKCRFPQIARPSMEALGIDVFATAKNAGFDLKVITSRSEAPTYFGMILVR